MKNARNFVTIVLLYVCLKWGNILGYIASVSKNEWH